MTDLFNVTLTSDEVEALRKLNPRRQPSLQSLSERVTDDQDGLSQSSRDLILTTAKERGRVEFHTPQWEIHLWKIDEDDGAVRWGARGTLRIDGLGFAGNVRGARPEDALDSLLDFHGCGPTRNFAGASQ